MEVFVKSIILCGLLGLGLSVSLLAADKSGADKPATQPVAFANTKCPIEGDNDIDPKVCIVQDGKKVGFCCPDCIAEFKKDPAKYMANLK